LTTQLASLQTTCCKCFFVFALLCLNLHDDIDVDDFVTELTLLKNISPSFVPYTFETVRGVSKALTPALRKIYRSAVRQPLLRLYLTVPMTNIVFCTGYLNYLTNKLSQEHLKHRTFLHIHKHLIDQVDLITIVQEFIAVNDRRSSFFGKKFVL